MKSIGETLYLFVLFFQIKAKAFIEECRIRRRYWPNVAFQICDRQLCFHYRFKNPYRISKRFLIKQGADDIYCYGETPLTTLEKIAKECSISSHDSVIELGCGRGRGVFFLATHFGCNVKGIEWIPEFVGPAHRIAAYCPKVSFACEDMLTTDLSKASIIYLYGTSLDDATLEHLIKRFEKLPIGTKIITVSYPLTGKFELCKQFNAEFPWGRTQIFLQKRI